MEIPSIKKSILVKKMAERELVRIEPARSPQDLGSIVQLFSAYAESLGLDLSFQDFDTELTSLPGKYAPPTGEILLARDSSGDAMGCVAVRPLSPPDCCEMKRLYIIPAGRGLGIGKRLVQKILDTALSLGYNKMKLDTLPSMRQAVSLYESAGFVPITPYYKTPLPGTVFLGRQLEPSSAISDSIDHPGMLMSGDTAKESTFVAV